MRTKVSSYINIMYYRLLSKDKTLQRLLSLLKVMKVLLSYKDNQSLWRRKLGISSGFLRDICGHLDDLKSKLQGGSTTCTTCRPSEWNHPYFIHNS
jgi:hypothetical protein